jgi:predicted DNA-binding transcriptional regulator AlpA
MTLDELIRSGEPTVNVETAAQVLGIGRTLAYTLARQGELPGVIRLGHRFVVAVPRLLQALGAGDGHE